MRLKTLRRYSDEQIRRDYGSALIRVALSKEQLALVRVISMEATKFPELGTRFHDLGPKPGEERPVIRALLYLFSARWQSNTATTTTALAA
jgi:hypothetical protein